MTTLKGHKQNEVQLSYLTTMTVFKKYVVSMMNGKENERMNEHLPLVELCCQGRTCPSPISSTINPT
jgi:hypothetical protein